MKGYDHGQGVAPASRTREIEGGGLGRALPVFDRARSKSANPEERIGLMAHTGQGTTFGAFRETRRRPPREVVTAVFMGDPAPNRVVPDIPEDQDARVWRQPAAVHLTFAAMRGAHGDDAS